MHYCMGRSHFSGRKAGQISPGKNMIFPCTTAAFTSPHVLRTGFGMLCSLAQGVGLEKLTERVTHPLNGLRVASYWSDNRSSIAVFLLSSLAMTRPLSLPGHIKENHNIFQRMFRFIL